jgi:hypothetical protein
MRKVLVLVLLVLVVADAIIFCRYCSKRDSPHRRAVQAIEDFQQALQSSKADAILDAIAVPAAMQDRTPAEQVEFVSKALRDEISPEGIAALNGKSREACKRRGKPA